MSSKLQFCSLSQDYSCRFYGHCGFLLVRGSSQMRLSTMKLGSDLSGLLCAAERATTVFTARSLVDCQRRCSTQQTKCHAANFYSDTKTCEIYKFKPTTFTSSRTNCRLFSVKKLTHFIVKLYGNIICTHPILE